MFIQYSKWCAIPLAKRVKLANEFGVAKTRSTSVVNDKVVDDGYEIHAVETALNMEALQNFTGSKEKDMNVLLDLAVEKVDAPVVPIVEVVPVAVSISDAKPEKIKIDDKPSKAKVEKILKAVPQKVKRPR